MDYASIIVIQVGTRIRTHKLPQPWTIHEVRGLFYKILGWCCEVEISNGVARVNCERRNKGREKWKSDFVLQEETLSCAGTE